jgi:integrase
LSHRTAANTHSVFFQAMEIAVRDGHCASNPVALVQPPRPIELDVKVWTMDELRRFLETAATHRLAAAVTLLATTGMRRGEVLGLRWRDVDLEDGWVSVTQTLTEVAGKPVVSVPKNAAARRRIDLDQRTIAALRTHRVTADVDAVFVFESVGGGPVNPRSFSPTFDRLVERAGVRRIRMHDVRHTYASLALRNGMYPLELSERLGHTTVSITMDVYAHLIPRSDRRHLDAIGVLIFSHTPTDDS